MTKGFIIVARIGSHWLVHTNEKSEQVYSNREIAERQIAELRLLKNGRTGTQVWEEMQIVAL